MILAALQVFGGQLGNGPETVYKVQTQENAWAEYQIMLAAADCRFCIKVMDYKVSFEPTALQTVMLGIIVKMK